MPPSQRPPDDEAVGEQRSSGDEVAGVDLFWSRPAGKAPALTRDEVVACAIRLADAEGLEAVSVRRVAAQLRTRPMRLYSFVERKQDLIDLMTDQVIGEALLDDLPGDWREALRRIATHTRAGCLRHPWIISASAMRPRLGPNAIRHREQSLGVIDGLPLDPAEKQALLNAVDTFALGHVMGELAQLQSARREGYTAEQWHAAVDAYLEQLVSTGAFPHLAAMGAEPAAAGGRDRTFELGLDWLIAGVEVRLAGPR